MAPSECGTDDPDDFGDELMAELERQPAMISAPPAPTPIENAAVKLSLPALHLGQGRAQMSLPCPTSSGVPPPPTLPGSSRDAGAALGPGATDAQALNSVGIAAAAGVGDATGGATPAADQRDVARRELGALAMPALTQQQANEALKLAGRVAEEQAAALAQMAW